ncbi:MAG: peptidoglycan-binding domain-containing protein [Pseudomonadota bacterium]
MTSWIRKLGIVLLFAATQTGMASAQQNTDYPDGATPGQCFARIVTPPTVQQVTTEVEVTPASSRHVVIPAIYETRDIDVQIREESTRVRTIPATYRTTTERVMVTPEQEVLVSIPAQYETWTETIEIEPAKAVWQPGSGLYGRAGTTEVSGIDVSTGDILCRVMQPARTMTVERSRMVAPPRTERRIIAATYKTIIKQVVDTPARVETVIIPAEYMTIPVEVMVQAERVETQIIPATYRTVERAVVAQPSQLIWTEVLCDTNANEEKIAEIQRGLVQAGYPISVDGIFGPETLDAMEAFQRENSLPVGYMTIETVHALNVDPYANYAQRSSPAAEPIARQSG